MHGPNHHRGLSLGEAFPHPQTPHRHARMGSGDSFSVSPMSSTATSPTASPTSTFRGMYHHPRRYHRFSQSVSGTADVEPDSRRSRSRSPNSSLHSASTMSSFRRYSQQLLLLRRRPSAVDLALSEERLRCDEDRIERCGLDLMEPRPVDPLPLPPVEFNTSIFGGGGDNNSNNTHDDGIIDSRIRQLVGHQRSPFQQPRFVMGGIFEVMEGRA